jgi:hypothetical protein
LRNDLILSIIATPVDELSDRDIKLELGNMQTTLILSDGLWPSTVGAVERRIIDLENEAILRGKMTLGSSLFNIGDRVITTSKQRGWQAAGCAEPPIGLTGTVRGHSPVPGKLTIEVDLRDLGYEPCYDEEDNFKELYLWIDTLIPA